MSTRSIADSPPAEQAPAGPGDDLDVERDSDVPISTQIFWQISYQIDSGRLLPGTRLPPVRELGGALRVNPNTIRAVYRRLADAGYVTTRHGAGTHVADRLLSRRGEQTLSGIVAEMLRQAARAGFTPDEAAAATFAAASERKRPGPAVRILFAECTRADSVYDAARINEAFAAQVETEGALLEEIDDRLARFHYDLVATPAFHADEAMTLVAGRLPLIAMLQGPGMVEITHEIALLEPGQTIGVVCASDRGTANIEATLALSGTSGIHVVAATPHDADALRQVDDRADLILLSREALALSLEQRFSRPERLRAWAYEFDPSGLELLRRSIEHVQAARRSA
jgi:DNA-binding transcriptional regulator YhcF (GntR family)